jgi:hypothetical protein
MGALPRKIFPHASSTSRGAMLGFGMVAGIWKYDARCGRTMYCPQAIVLVAGTGKWVQVIDAPRFIEIFDVQFCEILPKFCRYKSSQQMASMAVTKIKPNSHFWFMRC